MRLSKLNCLILHYLVMFLICQFAMGNCVRARENEEGHETTTEGGGETNPEGGHETTTEEDPYKPFKVHEEMSVCSAYQDNSCCSSEEAEFLEKYIFPGYEGLLDDCHSCVDAWIKVMCTTTCSPHQSTFLQMDETAAYLYICPDLCDQLYFACGSETLYPPKKVRVRYKFPEAKEFCESGLIRMDAGFGLVKVKVGGKDEMGHNVTGCLSEAMLEAENPYHVKPYCVAHHAAHHKANELVIFMIPFVFGVILANWFHHIHLSFIPESGVLIIAGAIYGLLMINFGGEDAKTSLSYDQTVFNIFLLPPIIFESGYSLRQKRFMANMDAILFYAIIGTVVAWLVIGPGLYLAQDFFVGGLGTGTIAEWLTFSALISAVDPVATLATFSSLGVEEDLAMIIFGEALINDAVAIVLFEACKDFVENPAEAGIGQVIISLLKNCLGSPLLGIAIGVLSSLIFKIFNFGYDNFFLETAVFITLTWMSFLTSMAAGLSPIISSLVCGLVCEHYTYRNLTKGGRELTLLWYKQWSTVCDMLIFYMMGMMAVVTYGSLTWRFTLICFGLILVGRLFSVFPLTCIINSWRGKKKSQISWQYQIIIWFSGLRGAIAVTLALELPTEMRDALTAATVAVAITTVFVFGGLTSVMLKCLGIKMGLEEREKTMKPHGIAEVQEMKGWKLIDNKYLKPCFIRDRNLRYPEFEEGPQAHLDNMMFQLHKEELEKSKIEIDEELGGSVLQVVKSTVGSIFNRDLEEASKFQSINKDTGMDMNDLGRSRGATRTRGTTNRGSTQGEGKVINFSRTMFAASPPAN